MGSLGQLRWKLTEHSQTSFPWVTTSSIQRAGCSTIFSVTKQALPVGHLPKVLRDLVKCKCVSATLTVPSTMQCFSCEQDPSCLIAGGIRSYMYTHAHMCYNNKETKHQSSPKKCLVRKQGHTGETQGNSVHVMLYPVLSTVLYVSLIRIWGAQGKQCFEVYLMIRLAFS